MITNICYVKEVNDLYQDIKDASYWSCTVCSYKNDEEESECVVCNAPRFSLSNSGQFGAAPNDDTPWTCFVSVFFYRFSCIIY